MECRFPVLLKCFLFKLLNPSYSTKNVVNLSYRILGDNNTTDPNSPPIFILHGLLGTKRHWEGLGKTILNVSKRSVITVDLRNHGESPHVSPHKYEEMAADVLQLFKKLEVDKATLIGHSMGGRTCMCVALMEPDKVASVLVIDISPVSTTTQLTGYFPKILAAMKTVDFKGAKTKESARAEAEKQVKDVVGDKDVLKAVLSNAVVRPDGTIGWTCNLDLLIKHFKYVAEFPKMKGKKYYGPVLLIGGQLSEYIPPDDLPAIRELFPRAVITFVPKTGHNLHVDDPKAFLERTIHFLRTNE